MSVSRVSRPGDEGLTMSGSNGCAVVERLDSGIVPGTDGRPRAENLALNECYPTYVGAPKPPLTIDCRVRRGGC
ncbi:MAG: hypothetical protein ACRD6N_06835 [Pyrinomonadaceae bacterium]